MPSTARQLRQPLTIEAIGRVPYFADVPNTPTTMLRNIVAGKVAVGPLNTSNSKTVTILTL